MADPLQFPTRSDVFYRKFEALNRRITRIVTEHTLSKWEPWVKYIISVGAKIIEISINPADPSQKIWTAIGTEAISTGVTPILMRLAIDADQKTNADLDVSLDFMRGNLQNGRSVWNEIIGQLRSTNGYTEIETAISSENDANQNAPQNFGVNSYGY